MFWGRLEYVPGVKREMGADISYVEVVDLGSCSSLGSECSCPREVNNEKLIRVLYSDFPWLYLPLFSITPHWWLSPDRISHCLLCVLSKHFVPTTIIAFEFCWDCLHIQHLSWLALGVLFIFVSRAPNPLPHPLYSFSVYQMLESYAVIPTWKLVIGTHKGSILNC